MRVWGEEGAQTRRASSLAVFSTAPGSHWQLKQESSVGRKGLRIFWLLGSRLEQKRDDRLKALRHHSWRETLSDL